MKYQMWTDGSCAPNPGPGGWGCVLIHNGETTELCGCDPETTNNRMEMLAAIIPLRDIPDGSTVTVTSDSKYLVVGATVWMHRWKRLGWKRHARGRSARPVKNDDLWKELISHCARLSITWKWVRGHNGNRLNERADYLATTATRANDGVPGTLTALMMMAVPDEYQ